MKYVLHQESNHKNKKKSFRDEYLEILQKYDVKFQDEYVFEFFDDVKDWD